MLRRFVQGLVRKGGNADRGRRRATRLMRALPQLAMSIFLRRFIFPKNCICAMVVFGDSADPACVDGRTGLIEPTRKAKNLETNTFGLDLL
jgi:hypothetical protein